MIAARASLWFQFADPERELAPTPRVRSFCTLCNGTGWRPVLVKGDKAVTRCQCRMRRVETQTMAVRDHKAAAAGER